MFGKIKSWKKISNTVTKRDGSQCIYCHRQLDNTSPHNHPNRITLEHIIPQSKGGDDLITNLTVACGYCNSKRGSDEFFDYLKQYTHDNETLYRYSYLLLLGDNLKCSITAQWRAAREESRSTGKALDYLLDVAEEMEIPELQQLNYRSLIRKNSFSHSDNEELPMKDLSFLLWRVSMSVRYQAETLS